MSWSVSVKEKAKMSHVLSSKCPKASKTKRLLLRVSSEAHQGGRKCMEDFTSILFDRQQVGKDIGQAFIAVYDGHGGREAAVFARARLWETIKKQRGFYSADPEHVVKAIKEGFLATHRAMWKVLGNWPKTRHGLPSTSGTTVTAIIIRGHKMFVAHVGDSGAVLAAKDIVSKRVEAEPLTDDHKPDTPSEKKRIEKLGGSVLARNGVFRVAWERPVCHGHTGPMRRSTKTERVPFLAVSRSLGDLWSFDYFRGEFVVSPVPDVEYYTIDPSLDKYVILASDGLWGVMFPDEAVRCANDTLRNADELLNADVSHRLVAKALSRWRARKLRADNTTAIVVFFEDGGTKADPKPTPDTLTPENQTDTDTASDVTTDLSQENSTTGNPPLLNSNRPALVRKLAFRYPDFQQVSIPTVESV